MIIGLVVALALNLRGQTSYERYYEGRRMWSGLGAVSTNLARHIWLHAKERDGALGKEDLVHKLSAMNLVWPIIFLTPTTFHNSYLLH